MGFSIKLSRSQKRLIRGIYYSGIISFSNALYAQNASVYFDIFKESISKPYVAIEIEFEEGKITEPSEITLEKSDSTVGEIVIIKQSVRSYSASCQSNAFVLLQKLDTLQIDRGAGNPQMNVTLSSGCGYFGGQAWSRNDPTLVHFEQRNGANSQTNRILAEINFSEKKVWSIYNYGLPKFNVSSIEWSGTHLKALTDSGNNLMAQVFLNENEGTLNKLSYTVSGSESESGEILYSYPANVGKNSLPESFEKRVLSGRDRYIAARLSSGYRILRRVAHDISLPSERFISPMSASRAVVSNGVLFARIGGKLVTKEQIADMGGGSAKAKTISRIFIGLFVFGTVLFIFLLIRKHKQSVS